MISWLLGVGLAGGAISMLILPSALKILTPVLQLAAEAVLNYFRAIGYGLKTSNYGSWTLIVTAFILGALWFNKACTASYRAPVASSVSTPAAKSSFVKNQGRGAVTHITKDESKWFETPRDIFCRYFGCI